MASVGAGAAYTTSHPRERRVELGVEMKADWRTAVDPEPALYLRGWDTGPHRNAAKQNDKVGVKLSRVNRLPALRCLQITGERGKRF